MPKVKLLVSRAGTNFVNEVGEVIEVAADEAKRMIAAGQAEPPRGRSNTATVQSLPRTAATRTDKPAKD